MYEIILLINVLNKIINKIVKNVDPHLQAKKFLAPTSTQKDGQSDNLKENPNIGLEGQ